MFMRFLGAAATAAVLVTGSQAAAATVSMTIDDFNGAQWVEDGPTLSNPNASQVADATVLGGFRDLSVSNTKADGNRTAATQLQVDNGNLKFSNIAGARGEGYLTYDGDDDPTSVNTTGLGGVNLVLGASPYFLFETSPSVPFDNFAFFRVEAWDMAGNFAFYDEDLVPGFDPRLRFSAFTTDAGFSFANIGALRFFISTTGTTDSVDGAIASIKVEAVPLPASGLLLLGGMGGLAFLRRRKKA